MSNAERRARWAMLYRAQEEPWKQEPLEKEQALEEPRTRPIQGGWLEKDTLTGEVHEPTWRRYDE